MLVQYSGILGESTRLGLDSKADRLYNPCPTGNSRPPPSLSVPRVGSLPLPEPDTWATLMVSLTHEFYFSRSLLAARDNLLWG